MADTSNILQILIQTTKDAGHFNIIRFEEIRYRDYPFSASNEFIGSMIKIHKELLQKLTLLEQSSCSTSDEYQQKTLEVRRYSHLFSQLHSLLQILEMGGREYVPEVIARLLGARISSLNPKTKFLFLPDYEFNYSYLEIITPLREALQDAVSDIDKVLSFAEKLTIFWFPLAHKEDMLLNSLLGHEFGHFVNEEKNIVGNLIASTPIPPSEIAIIADKWLKSRLAAEKKPIRMDDYFGIESTTARIKKEVIVKISEQLKELISDTVGFYLFGPIFLVAQYSYLASLSSLEHKAEGYPPAKTRLCFLLDLFDNMGYPKMLKQQETLGTGRHKEIAARFVEIVEAVRNTVNEYTETEDEEDEEESLVNRSIQNLEKTMWREVYKTIKGQEYTPETFQNEAFKLTDLIDSLVPPAEIEFEHPANIISILNAGMLYEFTSIDRLYASLGGNSTEKQLSTRNKLHKLVMKAGELSQFQKMLQETEKQKT